MRKMFSKKQIQNMTLNYIEGFDEIELDGDLIVNGDIKGLENIVDSEGHKRFIEGSIIPVSLIEDIVVYSKWSLSGSHLMLVLALYNNTGEAITISQYSELCNINNMPEWIYSKIYSTNPNSNILGDVSGATNIKATKSSSSNLQFVTFVNLTISDKDALRLQFDLLIDNAN